MTSRATGITGRAQRPILTVSQLSFAYGSKTALRNVSFHIDEGNFCALLGPNGAGKSTLFALLTGLFATDKGQIQIDSIDFRHEPRKALARIGVVFQQPTLDLDLSVWRNLTYYAALHGLSGRDAARRIERALDRLSMSERAHEMVRSLNGGHRRRMEIARALIHDPALLLLDEPTVGLDPKMRAAITAHVHQLCREERLTVLWATHLVDEIAPDDQLIILHQGNIKRQGQAEDIADGKTLSAQFSILTQETESICGPG